MTFIWLVVWLFNHTPAVAAFGSWNNWGIALTICMFLDLLGALSASGWRRQRIYIRGGDWTSTPPGGWKHGEPGE